MTTSLTQGGLLTNTFNESIFISLSSTVHDAYFTVGHLLKIGGYVLLLIGLLIDMLELFSKAEENIQSLEEKISHRTYELQYQATHDALTGLPNRIMLYDRIQQAIERNKRNHTSFGIFFFDIDRFKLINDNLSHAAGDELLRELSKRLQCRLRATDTLARFGGDEFVIVITDLLKIVDLASIASAVLKTIKSPPFVISGYKLTI